MTFRFIHTSDWQIGKPFRNFEDRAAGRLEAAREAIVDRIAALAKDAQANHVLVAGDVYDVQSPATELLMRPIHRMARAAGVTWWLMPGNHDPARAQGLWPRLRREGLPANVRLLDEPVPAELEPGVWVLPAPLMSRSQPDDPTAYMGEAATPAGALRIGLAHGSIKGFGSTGESSISIDPDRARKSGLDYLALGDWHGTAKVNARTWYCGTPEPDRFPDNAPGSVLAVTLEAGGAAPKVEPHASAAFVWAKLDLEVNEIGDLRAAEGRLQKLTDDMARLVVRVKVQGRLPLQDMAGVERWCADLAARVALLSVDTSGLLPSSGGDLSMFEAGSELGRAAEQLSDIAAQGDETQRPLAAAALKKLVVLAELESAGEA